MRFRIEATVEESDLAAVINKITDVGARRGKDYQIAVAAVRANANAIEPKPDLGKVVHELHSQQPKPERQRRVSRKSNGGAWPAEGSIYASVLKALEEGPKTPNVLREVLTKDGFSAGSVNSALGRLEKAEKARKLGDGSWAVAMAESA